jgi:cyclopropane-fatty-acyl-phospholipid synthase
MLTNSKDFTAGYFAVIDSVLNATGVACFQVITIPEARFDACEYLK